MKSIPVRMNFGDWLHLVQLAVLCISLGIAWARFDSAATQVQRHTAQLDRIEHYLSARDPNYWRIVEGEKHVSERLDLP
jgi:hypothetical protein